MKSEKSYSFKKALTHDDRVAQSKELKLSLNEINTLTGYHELTRLSSINKYTAKILLRLGINSIIDLRKTTASKIQNSLKQSYLHGTVFLESELLETVISEAKQTKALVFDLKSVSTTSLHYRYTDYKNNEHIEIEPPYKKFGLSIGTLSLLLLLSLFSPYFIAIIFIIVSYHILNLEKFSGTLTYKLRDELEKLSFKTQGFKNIISGIQNNFCALRRFTGKLGLSIFTGVFVFGILSGNVFNDLGELFMSSTVQANTEQKHYLEDPVLQKYSQNDLTRGELVYLLINQKNSNLNNIRKSDCFNDTDVSVYYKEICYAKKMGYIQGDSNNNFNPTLEISHAAGLKLILNFHGYEVPKRALYLTYDDLQTRTWQATYAEYAKRIGLISESQKVFEADINMNIHMLDEYLAKLADLKK